jgi:hypothetical protein
VFYVASLGLNYPIPLSGRVLCSHPSELAVGRKFEREGIVERKDGIKECNVCTYDAPSPPSLVLALKPLILAGSSSARLRRVGIAVMPRMKEARTKMFFILSSV